VDLCGHGTLAAAHVLFSDGCSGKDSPARFFTKSGTLTAEKRGGLIELDFPVTPEEPATPPAGLAEALDVQPCYTGKNRFDYLVELASEDKVRATAPDFRQLGRIPVRGIIVTAAASAPGFEFVSRFFAPAVGINEDPVTGSAHCCLGPFWQKRLKKHEFAASRLRGGVVRVRLDTPGRVKIAGSAITVWEGSLRNL
jgi:PhzF family phenazine biosynthesis protein